MTGTPRQCQEPWSTSGQAGHHAVTGDWSLAEQARGASWFDADALIVIGSRRAGPPLTSDRTEVRAVAGSGVRRDNLAAILACAGAVIVVAR